MDNKALDFLRQPFVGYDFEIAHFKKLTSVSFTQVSLSKIILKMTNYS